MPYRNLQESLAGRPVKDHAFVGAGTAFGAGTITGNGSTVIDGPTVFADVSDVWIEMEDGDDVVDVVGLEIDGDLGIDGGDDSNTNRVLGSTIDGDVTIENGDTDHGTDNNLIGVAGQYNYLSTNFDRR